MSRNIKKEGERDLYEISKHILKLQKLKQCDIAAWLEKQIIKQNKKSRDIPKCIQEFSK